MKKGHIPWLDWVRLLACLAVVATHARGAFLPEYAALPAEQHNPLVFAFYALTRLGTDAVICFFALSGFLVGGKVWNQIRNRSFDAADFALARCVRILPPLALGLVLCYALGKYYGHLNGGAPTLGVCMANFFSLQGVFSRSAVEIYWTLPYEVWFYVLVGSIGALVCLKSTFGKIISMFFLVGAVFVYWHLNWVFLLAFAFGAVAFNLTGWLIDRT